MAQKAGSFTPAGNTNVARRGHTATLLTNGSVLIAGGWAVPESSGGSLASAEAFDPSTGSFSFTGSMATSRRYHTATLLADGRVLIAGGSNSMNPALSSAELYDPANGTFAPTGSMAVARSSHMAVLLGNGKVLIAGGLNPVNCSPCPAVLTSAELYDPGAGTFTPTGDMISPSYEVNTPFLLPNGNVFIGGGLNSQVYDPQTGRFTATGGWYAVADDWPDSQTMLLNGSVLVTGGDPDGFGASAFAGVYDPAKGIFSKTSHMNAPRDLHTSTLLPDGKALIVGGQLTGGASVGSAEIYDPANGTFDVAGNMITPRCCHTATLLNNGRVLIVGGVSAATGYPTYQPVSALAAELYNPTKVIVGPDLFGFPGSGNAQGAIWDAFTGQPASADAPAPRRAPFSRCTPPD